VIRKNNKAYEKKLLWTATVRPAVETRNPCCEQSECHFYRVEEHSLEILTANEGLDCITSLSLSRS
jgi:hypothetical protein